MAKAKTVEGILQTDYLNMEPVSAKGKNTVVIVEGITTSDILHTAQFQIKDGFSRIVKQLAGKLTLQIDLHQVQCRKIIIDHNDLRAFRFCLYGPRFRDDYSVIIRKRVRRLRLFEGRTL